MYMGAERPKFIWTEVGDVSQQEPTRKGLFMIYLKKSSSRWLTVRLPIEELDDMIAEVIARLTRCVSLPLSWFGADVDD